MAHIELKQAYKAYGDVKVFEDFNLHIEDGEFTVCVGPSGCGKSTLLRMIAGLEEFSDGTLLLDGRVANAETPSQRGVAMVFQNYALYPHMTVEKNIGFGLKVSGVSRSEVATRVKDAANSLQIEQLMHRKPAELSGGQRQRVAIGRAIVRNPDIFLFDEPLSNLDAELRVSMRLEIRRLHQKIATTIIYVTHDQTEAMTLADRIVVLNQGKIEQVGSPKELYECPASKFVAGFIGSPRMNMLLATARQGLLDFGADGQLTLPSSLNVDLVDGVSLTVGFRSEDIILEKGVSATTMHVAVEAIEYLGDSKLIYARSSSGQLITIKCRNDIIFNTGQSLLISVVPGRLHLFDSTGLSLQSKTRTKR